jgi:hypothetical protein
MDAEIQKVPPVIKAATPPKIRGIGSRRLIALGSIVIVVALLLTLVTTGVKKKQNKAVLAPVETLFALKYPQQLSQAQPVCTEQGFKLLPHFVGDSGKLSLSACRIEAIKSNPGLCDVELRLDTAQGESQFYIRLKNESGWKFHDVYIAKSNGKEVNLLASYIVEHPILSYAEVNSDKIVKGVKDTADFLSDLQKIGNSLDQIFDGRNKTPDDRRLSADVIIESGSE